MTLFSGPGVSSIKKKDANSTHLRGLLLRLDEETDYLYFIKNIMRIMKVFGGKGM